MRRIGTRPPTSSRAASCRVRCFSRRTTLPATSRCRTRSTPVASSRPRGKQENASTHQSSSPVVRWSSYASSATPDCENAHSGCGSLSAAQKFRRGNSTSSLPRPSRSTTNCIASVLAADTTIARSRSSRTSADGYGQNWSAWFSIAKKSRKLSQILGIYRFIAFSVNAHELHRRHIASQLSDKLSAVIRTSFCTFDVVNFCAPIEVSDERTVTQFTTRLTCWIFCF